ncbi:MAG TPA: hypothetical protein ENH82_17735 [bacterium]|nr:hypothetical protein [bacterium]
MQPYHFVLLLFAICLIHGIYRSMQDVWCEAALAKITNAFINLAKSAQHADEAFKQFHITISCKGGQVKDSNEISDKLKGREFE